MNKRDHRILRRDKRNLAKRLERKQYADQPKPMFKGGKIVFEMAERVRAIGYGGIGAVNSLVRRLKLGRAINESIELLKFHVPLPEDAKALALRVVADRFEHGGAGPDVLRIFCEAA